MIQTYLLTPWCRVLLEKLTGLQLVKKFPAFHGTRTFITVLTSLRHLSLSWASPIQSIYPHPTSWRSILILSTHLRLGLPSGLFPSGFPIRPLSSPIPISHREIKMYDVIICNYKFMFSSTLYIKNFFFRVIDTFELKFSQNLSLILLFILYLFWSVLHRNTAMSCYFFGQSGPHNFSLKPDGRGRFK